MNERQLTIFDIINITPFDRLLEKLSKYKIDEYYNDHFRGNYETFKVIEDTLSELDKYSEYKTKMLDLLVDYYKNNDQIEIVYYEDYGYIRINSDITRSSYPIFCLEMVSKEDR